MLYNILVFFAFRHNITIFAPNSKQLTMKRFTLFTISLLLISGCAYAIQPKMVVKDRTWWYNIEKLDGTKCDLLTSDWHSEFGIRIGEEVEIDGVKWHEINVVKRGDGEYHFGQIIQDENPICISYIREEDENVYVLLDDDLLAAYPQIHKVMRHSRWAKYVSSEPKEILVYHFGKEGDKFEMGAGTDAAACQITSVIAEPICLRTGILKPPLWQTV